MGANTPQCSHPTRLPNRREGNAVTFASQVEGSLPLALQWLKNGSPITGATNSSLTLSMFPSLTLLLTALCTNSAGTSNSQPATLSIVARQPMPRH